MCSGILDNYRQTCCSRVGTEVCRTVALREQGWRSLHNTRGPEPTHPGAIGPLLKIEFSQDLTGTKHGHRVSNTPTKGIVFTDCDTGLLELDKAKNVILNLFGKYHQVIYRLQFWNDELM